MAYTIITIDFEEKIEDENKYAITTTINKTTIGFYDLLVLIQSSFYDFSDLFRPTGEELLQNIENILGEISQKDIKIVGAELQYLMDYY